MEDLPQHKDNTKTAYLLVEYNRLAKEIAKNQALAQEDEAMKELALDEIKNLETRQVDILNHIKDITSEKTGSDEEINSLVLEVRAGAGGEESSIFAMDLAEMYKKYCEKNGWTFVLTDESRSESGGYKEAIFEIHGRSCDQHRRPAAG